MLILSRRNASRSRRDSRSTSCPSMLMAPSVGSIRRLKWADERRLAGAGQAHDDEDFLPRNVKVDVHQADNVPVLGKQALLADARFDARQRLGRRRPEKSCIGAQQRSWLPACRLYSCTYFWLCKIVWPRHAVEHDRERHHGQTVKQALGEILIGHRLQHLDPQAAHRNHGRNDDHGERHHDRLVDPGQDVRHRQRYLNV